MASFFYSNKFQQANAFAKASMVGRRCSHVAWTHGSQCPLVVAAAAAHGSAVRRGGASGSVLYFAFFSRIRSLQCRQQHEIHWLSLSLSARGCVYSEGDGQGRQVAQALPPRPPQRYLPWVRQQAQRRPRSSVTSATATAGSRDN
jgi:hypothetical protein